MISYWNTLEKKQNFIEKPILLQKKKHSTELATLYLVDEISKQIDNGNMVGALNIDLSKAFETLNHAVLLSKMKSYTIKSLTIPVDTRCFNVDTTSKRSRVSTGIKWFEDYLLNSVQICETDSQRSSPCPIKCGVPKGSILGPILFLLYFNDFRKLFETL